jgi:type IV pilus assembly protein PilW
MKHERGFTIVSLMVGMFVSLIVVLAVYGSASFFEINRRQMMAGNAAFENGVAGLTELQRAIRQAGLSIAGSGGLACPSVNIFHDGAVRADGAVIPPVAIIDGGADSDRVTVAYANSLLAAMPAQSTHSMAADATEIRTSSALGIEPNDLVMVGVPGDVLPCTLMQISEIVPWPRPAAPAPETILRHGEPSTWNPADRAASFADMPQYPVGTLIQRVGPPENWNWLTYRIADGRLEALDNTTGATTVLADDVVYLKAAYGTTSGTDRTIEQWVAATDSWATPNPAQLRVIRAIQLGVVARNPQRVKPSLTGGPCDATTDSQITLWPGGPIVDLSRTAADWACFTYRELTLVVPLRNMIFGDGRA